MNIMYLILLAGGGLILLFLVIGAVLSVTREKSLVDERLGQYQEEIIPEQDGKTTPVADWLDRRLEKSSWGDGISRDLARADLKLKPAEYVAWLFISAIGVGALLWYLDGKSILFGLIGGIIGLFIPKFYVRHLQSARLKKFDNQLADMLNLMVNGLKAGYSVTQAMEAVSKELPSPISEEFRRVVQEMQIGISMPLALDNLLRRIPSEDLDLVVTAINIQREVGGNLAEILDTISYTIRERVKIKGEVRVLTSQVVYSGRFLAMLPLIILAILWFVNRPYVMEFFNQDTRIFGIIALSIGGILIAIGYFVMMKIADIDV